MLSEKLLNESLPLESDNEDEHLSLHNLISDESNNPEIRLLIQEHDTELSSHSKSGLECHFNFCNHYYLWNKSYYIRL